MSKSKGVTYSKGENCPKCHLPMERRHKRTIPPLGKRYYKEWDWCLKCKHLQHYHKFYIRSERPQIPLIPLGLKKIDKVLPKIKKSDFIIESPQVLFESWENLKKLACPFCGNKLRGVNNAELFVCTSKKHKRSFAIKRAKLVNHIKK